MTLDLLNIGRMSCFNYGIRRVLSSGISQRMTCEVQMYSFFGDELLNLHIIYENPNY